MTGLAASPRLESDLFCPVCHNIFTDPVTLLCGHSLCWRCLPSYSSPFVFCNKCPVCPHIENTYPPTHNMALKRLSDEYKMRSQLAPSGGHNLQSEAPRTSCTPQLCRQMRSQLDPSGGHNLQSALVPTIQGAVHQFQPSCTAQSGSNVVAPSLIGCRTGDINININVNTSPTQERNNLTTSSSVVPYEDFLKFFKPN